MNLQYHIGEYYKYPGSSKRFKLMNVKDEWRFDFKGGHWCTDTIFVDLIRAKTGMPVNEDLQIELFKN